ncbi:MAG: hypothetical protein H0W76_05035 [Pyrinomonadaceae bacterium]|nr:hypothetical protein [Pyrinomonadaceae bacterium]
MLYNLQTMNAQLNIKDLSEYGLHIVPPSDSSYNEMIWALTQGKSDAAVESLRPYSVFVKNASGKPIVACQLKWELVKPDGKVRIVPSGFISMERLTLQGVTGTGDYIIDPNASWFFSPSIINVPQGDNLLRTGDTTQTSLNERGRRMRSEYLHNVSAELAQCASITVSIDGVFFADGTFVGPDSMHLYERVVTSRDARREFLQELEQEVKQGKSAKDVFKRVEHLYHKPSGKVPNFTTPEFYEWYKRSVAGELLSVRKVAGEESALKSAIAQNQTPWTHLK